MICTMMVYALSFIFKEFCIEHGFYSLAVILYAFEISFAIYVHWMFCYIYLKQQIEVKYLLDSRLYTGNQKILMKRNRENFCLEIANILNLSS